MWDGYIEKKCRAHLLYTLSGDVSCLKKSLVLSRRPNSAFVVVFFVPPPDKTDNYMTFNVLSFNQDTTCIAVANEKGLAVFNCDPFDVNYKNTEISTSVVELLFSTSLAAIVDPLQQNKSLKIINIKKNSTICELSYTSEIIDVKMNRKRMVIILTDKILIYDVSCMKLLHQIKIPINNNQLKLNLKKLSCDLSSCDNSILAFQQIHPDNRNTDEDEAGDDYDDDDDDINDAGNENGNENYQNSNVVIFDTLKMTPISIINCHKTSVEKLIISQNGALLASASVKGTIIRIFNTKTSKKVCEFRRGSLPAIITSLAFSSDYTVLACSSLNGTVHFFKIPQQIAEIGQTPSPSPAPSTSASLTLSLPESSPHELPHMSELEGDETEEIQRLMDSVDNVKISHHGKSTLHKTKQLTSYLWSSSQKYLPTAITSIIQPQRNFASIRLPSSERCIIGLVDQTCYVATASGLFLQYTLPMPPANPAASPIECVVRKQNRISI